MIRAILLSLCFVGSALPVMADDSLAAGFQQPPAEARPWVYWFWNNGAVTKEGITADLEAMQRVGIGGVIIMDVLERFAPPKGDAAFFSETWRALFKHAVSEAGRLGLEVNMTNGPGWTGSSGAWITPELSMQALTVSNTEIEGPVLLERELPQPPANKQSGRDHFDSAVDAAPFYQDISVIAFPKPENDAVPAAAVVDITDKLGPNGRIKWEVPAGKWIIQRIGHTSTGMSTRPPVLGGNGLECDKLSRKAMDAHFSGMLKHLIDDVGPLAGKALTATHIDSWEVGGQDWTPLFREEFLKRRGYDPVKWLPCITGAAIEKANDKASKRDLLQIGGREMADRFRWDFQQTISELLAENYAGRLAELAHQHGMRLSIEGYNLNAFGDEATYTARADEPMSEFWTPFRFGMEVTKRKGHQMASVGHVQGKAIIGAEAFTSGDQEKWMMHPATIKAQGDEQFCQGINRFVFHRYAHQPYLDKVPGATMGPWGLHYERTQTWWEMSGAWHQYLSRCQFMLRRGRFVADLLYLRPEVPHQTYFKPVPDVPAGYAYDEISAEALIGRATVKDGRICLPDGMSYRMLVLPASGAMTPALAAKLGELSKAGAVIVSNGPAPRTAPGLQNYPKCDPQVAAIAGAFWPKTVRPFAETLTANAGGPDFSSEAPLHWIHRRDGKAEIYFVSSAANHAVQARCNFRIVGKVPELWDAETGNRRFAVCWSEKDGVTTVPLEFSPSGSWFIVFREPAASHPANAASNFAAFRTLASIDGPWTVGFSGKMGAPEQAVEFPKLTGWQERAEPGIRYFSGTAVYRKEFRWDNAIPSAVQLDLGNVEVMARVILNGTDCGVAWKQPFRVDVTRALKTGTNQLEIHVANLWPNRLIGDAALPENERHTWSSWQPFKKDDALLPSGLLGPVTLCSGEAP